MTWMEFVIPPILLLLIMQFGPRALITWFFEKVVEPRVAAAKERENRLVIATPEPSNAQKMAATRAGLDQLRARLEGT